MSGHAPRASGRPPGRSSLLAAILIAATVGLLTVLGRFWTPQGHEAPGPPPSPIGDVAGFVDPLEAAAEIPARFETAWNSADPAALDALISPGWTSVSLPGLDTPVLAGPTGRDGLLEKVGFLAELSDVDLGECSIADAPEPGIDAVVACPNAVFSGDYLQAIGGESDRTGISFTVDGSRIVTIESSGSGHGLAPERYCVWAESADPDDAVGLFDLGCRPEASAGTASRHAAMAAAYVAGGAPQAGAEIVAGRLEAEVVDRFASLLDGGDPDRAAALLGAAIDTADLPGFAGGASPDLAGFLGWSAMLFDLDLGTCRVTPNAGGSEVTCPDLTIEGRLATTVSPVPIPSPSGFTISEGLIVGVRPLGESPISRELADVCHRLRRIRPVSASKAFDGDCLPLYTAEAAAALLATLPDM